MMRDVRIRNEAGIQCGMFDVTIHVRSSPRFSLVKLDGNNKGDVGYFLAI